MEEARYCITFPERKGSGEMFRDVKKFYRKDVGNRENELNQDWWWPMSFRLKYRVTIAFSGSV